MLPVILYWQMSSEEQETQIRCLLTLLFTLRAQRILKRLAVEYGWSPEMLAANEERFIIPSQMVPTFDDAS